MGHCNVIQSGLNDFVNKKGLHFTKSWKSNIC